MRAPATHWTATVGHGMPWLTSEKAGQAASLDDVEHVSKEFAHSMRDERSRVEKSAKFGVPSCCTYARRWWVNANEPEV